MSIILNSSMDPRDNLDKARRLELFKFAQKNGVDIVETMPAILMRQILRQKGFVNINVPDRPLGIATQAAPAVTSQSTAEVDAVADLARQWREHSAPASKMSITELRRECKARGIKIARTDNIAALKAKLDGKQDAA